MCRTLGELILPYVDRRLWIHSRENTVLRAQLTPTIRNNVYVIPNAVIPEEFEPAPEVPPVPQKWITIVVVSRLAYRKGVDLLVAVAPRICKEYPNVRFLVGEYLVASTYIRADLDNRW